MFFWRVNEDTVSHGPDPEIVPDFCSRHVRGELSSPVPKIVTVLIHLDAPRSKVMYTPAGACAKKYVR